MTILDTQIYRLEEIRDEISDLIDEASTIVKSTDDYIIDGSASVWIDNIKENIQSETNAVTISTTITELWADYHNYVYTGEDK